VIPDQRNLWEKMFQKGDLKKEPSELARAVVKIITKGRLLELGSGTGTDAAFFSKSGFEVHAVEFTTTGNSYLKKKAPEIMIYEGDIRKTLPKLPSSYFDVVYSNLALHYFNHKETKKVFEEILRVLVPGGILAFSVKSTEDPLYGKGEEIEKDLFDLNGHVRHFFSREYLNEILSGYEILMMKEKEKTHDTGDKFVAWYVIARKPFSKL